MQMPAYTYIHGLRRKCHQHILAMPIIYARRTISPENTSNKGHHRMQTLEKLKSAYETPGGFAQVAQIALNKSFPRMDINIPTIVAEVTEAFNRYEQALVSNDVTTLDRLFWTSEHVIRYGQTENLHGHEEILAFRRSRPSQGLKRGLRKTVITTFGHDFATANTEFTKPAQHRVGRQSHSWARLEDGWRIVAAHVSWMDE